VFEANSDRVRLVFKHFPLQRHRYAVKAASAAMAAGEQGKFWQVHDRLFQSVDRLDDQVINGILNEVGLDRSSVDDAMKSPRIEALIARDKKEGEGIGVSGTPTIFINGKRFLGNRSVEGLSEAVMEALSKASSNN
jgi:protein-disulfide isomerase